MKFSSEQSESLEMLSAETAGDLAVDVMTGLSSSPKYLLPKYFYDDRGSAIFTEIMNMPDYYLTRCEKEILTDHSAAILSILTGGSSELSLIEPGSGDGSKTLILLRALENSGVKCRFIPVDVSGTANYMLMHKLSRELPGLKIIPVTGNYFDFFARSMGVIQGRKAILFLGSNIGNLDDAGLEYFLGLLEDYTRPGDRLVIGFDLKKSPQIIMNAYHDPEGITKRFNLNLLERINRELLADFDTTQFGHHTSYDPVSGEVKSYLVSLRRQEVFIPALGETFSFARWEPVFMELSRKFDLAAVSSMAVSHGFTVEQNFTDSRSWFVDSVWKRI